MTFLHTKKVTFHIKQGKEQKMPKTIYKCNQCGKSYSTYQEANNCERSHSINYSLMSKDSVVEKLKEISDNAHSWNINGKVLGIDEDSFSSLINRTIELLESIKEKKKLEVVGWTYWSFKKDWRCNPKDFEEARKAVVEEVRKNGYHFDGSYHQNGDFGVPILSNGERFQVSMRQWGGIIAEAFPEEFEDPDNQYNYVRWYLGAEDVCKEQFFVPDGSVEYYFEESDI